MAAPLQQAFAILVDGLAGQPRRPLPPVGDGPIGERLRKGAPACLSADGVIYEERRLPWDCRGRCHWAEGDTPARVEINSIRPVDDLQTQTLLHGAAHRHLVARDAPAAMEEGERDLIAEASAFLVPYGYGIDLREQSVWYLFHPPAAAERLLKHRDRILSIGTTPAAAIENQGNRQTKHQPVEAGCRGPHTEA